MTFIISFKQFIHGFLNISINIVLTTISKYRSYVYHGWTQLSGAGHAGAEDAGSSVFGGRSAYNEAGTDDSRDIR